jgi:hypothetical protein
MDSNATCHSRKSSSSDLDDSFLTKRDLKQILKTNKNKEVVTESVQPDMSMIFTPLVKKPTSSTRSCSSSEEPKKPQPSIF